MRDVFEAADAVHSPAMSEMVGSRNDDHDERHVGVDATGVGSMPRPGDGRNSPTTSVEVEHARGVHCISCLRTTCVHDPC